VEEHVVEVERHLSGLRFFAILCIFLSGALSAELSSAGAAAKDIPRAEHGAASMEYQQTELARILPAVDVDKPPPGLDSVVWEAFMPSDNAMSAQRVSLGRKLYFDKRLSADGTVACATCHDVTRGFTDQLAVSKGINDQTGRRNAPTTLNVALLQTFFLDGRSPTPEHQARLPIVNPVEMGMADGDAAVNAVKDDPEYQVAFKEAYGRGVNYDDIGRAIAAFERTLVFIDSPFRRFLGGDKEAISAEAKEGWVLFNEKGRCVSCHPMSPSNPLGTDNRFHNIGVSARHQDFENLAKQALRVIEGDDSEQKLDQLALSTNMSELGRFMVTKVKSDAGTFRTSILLNIGITPPYMHDGSIETLWDVIDHYNKGGEANLFLDGGIEPLALSEEEIDELVAFLFALTDVRFADENMRQFKQQKALAAEKRPLRDNDMAFRLKLAFE
jgi:cytochrome c peroxidase